jgi:hypothetical protein
VCWYKSRTIIGEASNQKKEKKLNIGMEDGKRLVVDVFENFFKQKNSEGIAAILREIPKESEFADIVCRSELK